MQVMKHIGKGINPGFETNDRHYQKSKTVVSQKGVMSSNFFLKRFIGNTQPV